ncbi:guanylate cyclase 32E [Arctopsyche grandis]|uniref:guanylate cyclase 32E n=1 Tax=Arctopsyche grandis TaxID=121162 RepID=UPI00406D8EB7
MYLILCVLTFITSVISEEFLLGYLTGSVRRPGDIQYQRPGLTISGAISLAIAEVNGGPLGRLGHNLNFTVAETYGEEVASIQQTAALWAQNVSAYIGPQESCVHEGRMAAAFNLPMISYFCTDYETSNKNKFPTFARSRPPDTQISKSVAAVLKYFNWTHVTMLYLDALDSEFSKVASTIVSEVRATGVQVHAIRTWHEPYHPGYTRNPFVDIILETYRDTRIYLSLGNHYDHIGLMIAMEDMNLFDNGEYWVLGIDIEQYDELDPNKYLHGLLRDKEVNSQDDFVSRAFRSFLGIVPSASKGFTNFSKEVNKYMEMPPFNYRNAVTKLGGMKMIRPEAAFLYDAIHLYAGALLNALREGQNPRNGTYIIASIKNTHYHSAMGYMAYMDDNGDAEGNYTLIGLMKSSDSFGLFPMGTLTRKQHNDSALPELKLIHEIKWRGNGPPISEPVCGFRGEKCITHTGEISAGVAGGVLLLLAVISLVLYRNWRYEQELDSLLWKLDFREIKISDEKENPANGVSKTTRPAQPMVRTSQVSLSSNPEADFRYSSIFTEVGVYKGRVLAIKRVRKKSIDITRQMKKELKIMRDLRHDNLNGFIGACIDPPNICIVSEYCNRGSLKDILDNEDIRLDSMFIASLVGDIIRGMSYLHESPLHYHGCLQSSNCLVDSRWVVKLTDFGIEGFRKGEDAPSDPALIQTKLEGLLYQAPELLRGGSLKGCPKGDVYSFGLLLYEIHTRRGPYGDLPIGPKEIIAKVSKPDPAEPLFRPSLEPLENSFDCVRDCLRECWAEQPDERPDFKAIRAKLRPLRKGMKPNIFDNMMAMMEKYANNLEVLVDERTDQLQEEKKKTEALLLEMLPRPVAEQLKRGKRVDPESFDCVTIYFSDIVGFTSMSAESTPLQVVDFLNDLYTCFDSIIESYDVYKVETIGDAYMVVSGLPLKNGDSHAAEVASMSLHLLSAVRRFRIRHRPLDQLRLRIGIHSGPVCAGVVGLKMPRYCLFGDTVNTASRMESTGAPLKIHCSKECKLLLDRLGGYQFAERGMVSMKGKLDQLTYWLIGEDPSRGTRREPIQPSQPRSSLKNKHLAKSPLFRCSSLESPKKLRFASGNLLEFHNNSSNNHHHYDGSPCKKSSGSLILESSEGCSECIRTSSTSCPCIEHMAGSTATLAQSQLCVFPPLDQKKISGPTTCFQSVPALNCNHLPKAEDVCMNRSAPNSPCAKYCFDHQNRKLSNDNSSRVFQRDGDVCRVILIDEDNIATEWIDDDSEFQIQDELNVPLLGNCESKICMTHANSTDFGNNLK